PPSPQLVKIGSKAKTPQTPAAVGYSFDGWYEEPECDHKYNFSTAVKKNITLYAGWTDKAEFYVCFTDLDADAYGGLYRNETDPSNVRYETVYTGSSIKPAVLVTGADGTPLRNGIDYTIKYSNNKNVSKGSKPAKVTVKGKGNFKGSKTLKFYVLPADLDRLKLDGKLIIPLQYVRKGAKPAPVLYYESYKITSKDLKYDTAKVKADKVLDLAGKGNFTGTLTGIEFRMFDSAALKTDMIKVTFRAQKHVYNGRAQTLTVATETTPGELKVCDGSGRILESSDYDVTYKNNVNAGKATAIIKGTAPYRGSAKVTFTIAPDSTNAIDVAPAYSGTNYYNPAGVKPSLAVTVTRDGIPVELTEGRDYKVAYKNNKAVGPGKYTVSFIGNYKRKATASGTFQIDRAAFAVSVRTADMTYKKKGKYHAKVFVTDGDTLLKQGRDYTVSYFTDEACTVPLSPNYTLEGDSATLYVKVTGKGNYAAGDRTESYHLYKLTSSRTVDLSKARIVDAATGKKIKTQTYTGRQVEPHIKVQVKTGKKWKDLDATQYDVTFINNVKKGKATVLVNAKGGRTVGSKTASYSIASRSFSLFGLL
ncbi:MAG: InlB B-repeat-containing protein, partial [Lachnospiraceae bacterium]|nr:InlB B-repeat-containing protein [Lachnospiraceae bacterium]